MREVGVDGLFSAPELQIPVDDSSIHSHCERRLLGIELDLGSSVSTFEALQWAIRELERMELQERYSVPESHHPDEDEADVPAAAAASLPRSSSEEQGGGLGGTVPEQGPPTSRCDQGSKDPVVAAARSGIHSECESLDEKLTNWRLDQNASSPGGSTHQTEEPAIGDVRNWRHIFKVTSKRKSDEEDPGSEGGKRNKMSKSDVLKTSKELAFEADPGEAGTRMADRIRARLSVPDCIFLTNLVSHCLLVSMDQVPPRTIQKEEGASVGLYRTGAADWRGGGGTGTSLGTLSTDQQAPDDSSWYDSDWLWLHKWLVKAVLSDVGDDGRFTSLDWLIAFMTASRQSLIKPILDDLASDLQKRETDGSVTLASYMRRTGVLEYAAFRWD